MRLVLAPAVADGEVEAVASGPLAHRVVADAKLLAQGCPVADVEHEPVELVGAGAGDLAMHDILARAAAEEVATGRALDALAGGFEGLATVGAGVGEGRLALEGEEAMVAATEEVEVCRAVVGAVIVAAAHNVVWGNGTKGALGDESLLVLLAEAGEEVEDVAVGEVVAPVGVLLAHLLDDGAGARMGLIERGDERSGRLGAAKGVGGHGRLLQVRWVGLHCADATMIAGVQMGRIRHLLYCVVVKMAQGGRCRRCGRPRCVERLSPIWRPVEKQLFLGA